MANDRHRRTLGLLDTLALIAATAVGLALYRRFVPEGPILLSYLIHRLPSNPGLRSVLDGLQYVGVLLMPFAVAWAWALPALGLRQPRPRLRRLVLQPGIAACGAVTVVTAIRSVGVVLVHALRLADDRQMKRWLFRDNTANWPYGKYFDELMKPALASEVAVSVAVAWVLLAIGGRWRRPSTWIDRAGRAVGIYWVIMVLAFTCLGPRHP